MNTQERVGVVKYLNQGADFVINSRREDAYKMMYEDCDGKYDIVWERPREQDNSFVMVHNGNVNLYAGTSEYWYIGYRCAGGGSAQATPSPAAPQVFRTDEDCVNSAFCKQVGRCIARDGKCVRE